MYNHAPPDYICPFCQLIKGVGDEKGIYTQLEDLIYQDEMVAAFINSRWWKNNPGHVIIIPTRHFENIYDLPLDFACEIHKLARKVAFALKTAYGCDGISTRQHNEPAGNQDVWHYHLHIFPRYKDDELYISPHRMSQPEERHAYADKLKQLLASS